jgi:hypothetical protein
MVRVLVELRPTATGGVEGTLTPHCGGKSQSFSGWLDLLRLLEAAVAARPDNGTEP